MSVFLSNNSVLQGGKYKIVRHISSGGFGNTYEGIHTMMEARVAIKEFFPKVFCSRDENTTRVAVAIPSNRKLVDRLRKKFNEEATSVFRMKHGNIVRVIDVFEENDTAYYVMDYIGGKSLNDLVKESGSIPEAEAVGYIRQVANALKYVHSLNRLHLDVKPGNIMVDANGHAVLIDFGTSKHYDVESGENTSTLMGVNTKGYAPIEQLTQSFTSFSPATDIYALGATLYKLLTGITPPDANMLMAEEETLRPLSSGISASVRNAVMSALALKRKDRPQTIDAFLTLLNSISDVEGAEDTVCELVVDRRKAEDNHHKTEETNIVEAEQRKRETDRKKAETARKAVEDAECKAKEEAERLHKQQSEGGKCKLFEGFVKAVLILLIAVMIFAPFLYSSRGNISSERGVSSETFVEPMPIEKISESQCQAESQRAVEDFNVPVLGQTISTNDHEWSVVSVQGTSIGTIVRKRCCPKSSNTYVWSSTDNCVEDCSTGNRYYLLYSEIGVGQSNMKALNSSDAYVFNEYYPKLPDSVIMINILSGGTYYATNVRIR